MKRKSDKNKTRSEEVSDWRKERVKLPCDLCGTVKHKRIVHEISQGCDRQKALDKPYATLVLCETNGYRKGCHAKVHESWVRDAQLALLMFRRPNDFDLEAFYGLTSRRFPSDDSVMASFAIISSELSNNAKSKPNTETDCK